MPVDEFTIGTLKVPKCGTVPHQPGSVSAILGTIKQPVLIRKREWFVTNVTVENHCLIQ